MVDELNFEVGDRVVVNSLCGYKDIERGLGGVVIFSDYTLPWPVEVRLDEVPGELSGGGRDPRDFLFSPRELDRA